MRIFKLYFKLLIKFSLDKLMIYMYCMLIDLRNPGSFWTGKSQKLITNSEILIEYNVVLGDAKMCTEIVIENLKSIQTRKIVKS